MDFILGLGLALPIATSTGIATVTGIAEGVSYQRKVNEEASHETRQLKFHVDVGASSSALQGGMIVLRDDRLWVETKDGIDKESRLPKTGHPFTGFYLQYPDPERMAVRGMVSTISRDPPVLNWIYVEKETFRVMYSNRSGSIAHHVGEWDWTEETGPESCLTFDGWEGFVAVEEEKGVWGLYFDMEDDGLKDRKKGRRVVEVTLYRRVISDQEKTEHEVKGKNMLEKDGG
ncbi:hypothetical protein ANO11243_010860 [Dothideomycetidae sp. 11243]|nr:hypothetical protein ANO11243_010860 [fungal sp. No.11243]